MPQITFQHSISKKARKKHYTSPDRTLAQVYIPEIKPYIRIIEECGLSSAVYSPRKFGRKAHNILAPLVLGRSNLATYNAPSDIPAFMVKSVLSIIDDLIDLCRKNPTALVRSSRV